MVVTKRQKEILDYLRDYTTRFGYAPTLAEIGRRFGLTSLATVHKHLKNLETKRLIRRQWNRSRAVELVSPSRKRQGVLDLPLLGIVAAGSPIEAVETKDSVTVPEELARGKNIFVLKVKGDSMIDEQIRDGDLILFIFLDQGVIGAGGKSVNGGVSCKLVSCSGSFSSL